MTGEPQIWHEEMDEWACDPARSPLPASVDVAIVGGGIVGCSAALVLASRGISVALFEKGRIAGEQSGRNWGWVRQQGRSPIELPMMMRSRELWRQWTAELGEDLGYHQGGCLYLARTAEELGEFEPWLEVARTHGLDTRLLDARALADVLVSGTGADWAGALYTASDGRAEPSRAARGIARSAAKRGARIQTHCAVRGVEFAAGRVQALFTEHGTVRTPTVLCAAGAWTRFFMRSLDVEVPQLKVLGTVARTAPAPEILAGEAWCPDVAIRRRADGGYTLAHGSTFLHEITPSSVKLIPKFLPVMRGGTGAVRLKLGKGFFDELSLPSRWPLDAPSPFESRRVLDAQPEPQVVEQIRAALVRRFPEISAAPIVESWGGMIETSPDILPILSSTSRPGLFVGTGLSGHGFGIGPGVGEWLADLVMGRHSAAAQDPFRLTRYFDGTPIVPGPAI